MTDKPTMPDSTTDTAIEPRLVVSRYDRVSSMLLAVVIMLGVLVAILLSVWLSNKILKTDKSTPVDPYELGKREEKSRGTADDIEPPKPHETDLVDEKMDEKLQAVTDAMAIRSGALEQTISGSGDGRGDKIGSDTRSSRTRESMCRWELRFSEGSTLATYAKQLDYFGIELGILRPDGKVEYAAKLSQNRPVVRTGTSEAEKRYHFTWRRGNLEQADRDLLTKAGIDPRDGVIFKFLPAERYQELITKESDFAEGKKPQVTIFGIKSAGGDFEFYVIRQSYKSNDVVSPGGEPSSGRSG